jgi:glycosyltransferase involved in cell wall biosynthesis
MLLYDRFPPDIRVEKEVKTLVRKGHKIFLIARDKKEHIKNMTGMKVIYLREKKIDFLFFCLNFTRPRLVNEIRGIIKKYDIDVIHIHDLPLVKTGYLAAKSFDNVFTVADLHEIYPLNRKAQRCRRLSFNEKISLFFLSFQRYERYERNILDKVDKIIIVTEESLLRFTSWIPRSKIHVVSNVVDIERIKDMKIFYKIVDKYKNSFVFGYMGGVAPHRGIDTSIKAMQYIKNKKIRLVIVGWGRQLFDLKKLAEDIGVSDKIDFVGKVPFEEVPSYIKSFDVCLVPHNDFEHTQQALPHKLFQYMYLKKPVLVSDCKPLKRVVSETKAGLIFKASDPGDMAKKMEDMFNYKRLEEFGKNGHKWTVKKYNWKKEGYKLIELFKELKIEIKTKHEAKNN